MELLECPLEQGLVGTESKGEVEPDGLESLHRAYLEDEQHYACDYREYAETVERLVVYVPGIPEIGRVDDEPDDVEDDGDDEHEPVEDVLQISCDQFLDEVVRDVGERQHEWDEDWSVETDEHGQDEDDPHEVVEVVHEGMEV
jgi:hypothetical protein